MVKLEDVCKEYISKLTAQELYDTLLNCPKILIRIFMRN